MCFTPPPDDVCDGLKRSRYIRIYIYIYIDVLLLSAATVTGNLYTYRFSSGDGRSSTWRVPVVYRHIHTYIFIYFHVKKKVSSFMRVCYIVYISCIEFYRLATTITCPRPISAHESREEEERVDGPSCVCVRYLYTYVRVWQRCAVRLDFVRNRLYYRTRELNVVFAMINVCNECTRVCVDRITFANVCAYATVSDKRHLVKFSHDVYRLNNLFLLLFFFSNVSINSIIIANTRNSCVYYKHGTQYKLPHALQFCIRCPHTICTDNYISRRRRDHHTLYSMTA